MVFHRLRLIAVCLALCGVSFAHGLSNLLLPDVHRQFAKARTAVDEGRFGFAWAYAETVVLGNGVTVAFAPDIHPAAREAALQAMAVWSEALGEPGTFLIVEDEIWADVRVGSVQGLARDGRRVGGYIRWSRSVQPSFDGWASAKTTADIQLSLDGPRGLLQKDHLLQAALHEFGHLLGLGDSVGKGRVMAGIDLRHPVTRPHEAEVEAILEARQEGQQIRSSALSWLL